MRANAAPAVRRALALVAAATMVLTGPAAAVARAGEDQVVTSARAEVSTDGRQVFDDAFKVVEVDDEVVDPGNYAYAHAVGCDGCQAVALSFQVVLVQQPPETLGPENLALGLNENCDSCVAAAGAYQFVVGGHPVRLTRSGRSQLADIASQVHALKHSGLTGPEMVDQAEALADQVDSVLKAELRSDDDGHGRVEERRVRDKGHDERSEDRRSFDVDD